MKMFRDLVNKLQLPTSLSSPNAMERHHQEEVLGGDIVAMKTMKMMKIFRDMVVESIMIS